MPKEIKFENLPLGVCVEASKGPGKVKIQMIEFCSTQDGQYFIERLEGTPDVILNLIGPQDQYPRSSVEMLLAIIRKDKTATVYLNEVPISAQIQIKRKVNRGDAVFKDDIVDVHKMRLNGVTIPDDAGVLLLFSVGWRKGLFYDFMPLHPHENIVRDYDLEVVLGQCYAEVMFQELFRITDVEWSAFFSQQWFPFRCLKSDTLLGMLRHIRAGWALDELLPTITTEVKATINDSISSLESSTLFDPHIPILRQAVERYEAGDYISATAILFPRIEGVMRTYHTAKGETSKPTQSVMASTVISAPGVERHDKSLLLPDKFVEYLKQVYFASFDPSSQTNPVSRHSVSHGIAPAGKFDEKAATIGLLLIQQMNYYFSAWHTTTSKQKP